MNGSRLPTMLRSTLSIFILVGSFHFLQPVATFSQGETTSAIVGQVSDASGAAVPRAHGNGHEQGDWTEAKREYR